MEKVQVLDDIILNPQEFSDIMRECGIDIPPLPPVSTVEEVIDITASPRVDPTKGKRWSGGSHQVASTKKPSKRGYFSLDIPSNSDDDFEDGIPMPKLRKMKGARGPIKLKIIPPVAPVSAPGFDASIVAPVEQGDPVAMSSTTPPDAVTSGEQPPNQAARGKNMDDLLRNFCNEGDVDDYPTEESPRRIFMEAKKKLRGLKARNCVSRTELLEEKTATGAELERLQAEMERLAKKREEIESKLQELKVADREVDMFLIFFEKKL